MKLRHKPSVRIRHGISLNLKKSLEILSLGTFELSRKVQKSLLENIFLEEIRAPRISIEEFVLRQRSFVQNKESGLENISAREKSLQDHLLEQIHLSKLHGRTKDLAILVITSLDKHGFLNEDHENIALKNGYTKKELAKVLDFFLQIDPTGVCARDIWQCLDWQARLKFPNDMALLDIIAVFQQGQKEIHELDEKIIEDLTAFLNIKKSKIQEALKKLKSLEVYPAAKYRFQEQHYIIPEILYSVENGKIKIDFANPLIPEVSLNSKLFTSLSKDKNQKIWSEMYYDARNLMKSMKYRQSSLVNIAKIIAEKQKEYFLKGEKHLKPLLLKDIAHIAKINISTVSRIMKNKYCTTPNGVFPLSFFLLKKIKSSENINLGIEDLKNAIKSILNNETPEKPFTDKLIAEKLREFGINIQRRTVTKYRKLLHISSTKQRTVKNQIK